MIRQRNCPSLQEKLWGGALWSPSYFAGSCGGAPIEIIRSTLSNNRHPVNNQDTRVSALSIPALNDGGFPSNPINHGILSKLDTTQRSSSGISIAIEFL
jgi:hypothetical protein